jgi:hypothetical protein
MITLSDIHLLHFLIFFRNEAPQGGATLFLHIKFRNIFLFSEINSIDFIKQLSSASL